MALYNKLYRHLSTDIGITAITTRIHPVRLPQTTSLPAVTYQKVSDDRMYSLSGYSTLENAVMQIDCWSSSYETVNLLSSKVKTAMDAATAFDAILTDDRDLYEDEVEIHRVSMDYSIWNRE